MGLDVSLWGLRYNDGDYENQNRSFSRVRPEFRLGELRPNYYDEQLMIIGLKTFRDYIKPFMEDGFVDYLSGKTMMFDGEYRETLLRETLPSLHRDFVKMARSSHKKRDEIMLYLQQLIEWFSLWLEFKEVIVEFCE